MSERVKNIYYASSGIKRAYFDCPKQVVFVSGYEYDFVEDNFDELMKNEELNPSDFDVNNSKDIIKLALLTRNYTGGIAYQDKVICGCCGGIFDLNEICYLKEYKTWVNISEEITGEEVEINE